MRNLEKCPQYLQRFHVIFLLNNFATNFHVNLEFHCHHLVFAFKN
jgi:hypothetical protein